MRIFTLFTALTVLACCFTCAAAADWNYIRGDAKGPTKWGDNAATCNGASNSPIDLKKNDATKALVHDWTLTNWDIENTWSAEDKGYTVQFDLSAGSVTTSGGNLSETYDLVQFHLHWGAADTAGGEHTVDGASYPMEVHFVHKKSTFNDLTAALKSGQSDALAAVGFFFTIQNNDNPTLTGLINALQMTREPNATVEGVKANLSSIAGTVFTASSFYRYMGGLTTPACNEVVKWTVFEQKIGISAAQMDVIRNTSQTTKATYGTELYRPVVALGSRTVTYYDRTCKEAGCPEPAEPAAPTTASGAPHIMAPAFVLLLSVVIKYF